MTLIKRSLAVLLGATMMLTLVACGGGSQTTTTPNTTPATEAPGTEGTGTQGGDAQGALLTGLGVTVSRAASKPAGDDEGVADMSTTVVAVLVDEAGTIADIRIDGARSQLKFDATGKLTGDLKAELQTKVELGDAYGMKSQSGIDKEWDEQAKALEDYARGKTIDEIKGLKLNDEGRFEGIDGLSGVTFRANDALATIQKAVENAMSLGAQAGDRIGLGSLLSFGGSKQIGENQRDQEHALAELYGYYGAVSLAADGTISSAVFDATQGHVVIDNAGQITNDLKEVVKTKNEIGEGYNMKGNSEIGKEWDEQAAFFAEHIKGKTPADVTSIKLDDQGRATDADILTGATIHVSEFIQIVDKAARNAG